MSIVSTTFAHIMALPSSQRSHKSDSSSEGVIDVGDGDDEKMYSVSDQEEEAATLESDVSCPPDPHPDPPAQDTVPDETAESCLTGPSARPVSRQDAARAALHQADRTDLSAQWSCLSAYADVIDDLDGVNNYAPAAVRLSNRCQNIQSVRSLFNHPYDRVMSILEQEGLIEDPIPESVPLPIMFPVPEELRRKKTAAEQQSLKQALIENLTDPDIEEIAFIANKKADGDVRNYLIRNGTEPKCFPQTSHLQDMEKKRPASSSTAVSGFASRNGWKSGNRGKRTDNGGGRFQSAYQKKRKISRYNGNYNGCGDDESDMDDDVSCEVIASASNGMCGSKVPGFMTGKELLLQNNGKKNGVRNLVHGEATGAVAKAFVNPLVEAQAKSSSRTPEVLKPQDRVQNVEDFLVQRVLNEIVVPVQNVSWDDIAGLHHAKERIRELVVIPLLRPDLFRGIRAPSKGLLLFGPPGTGKSMIGKCIASQSKSTFFSMSAASLTSKWIGEGEKMVRAMFAVARMKQPSVIFLDEIDSLLCQRSGQDHEASTRLKTEFLMQFEGVGDTDDDKLLVVGATNRPEALDEAARRRFSKRLMIGLPDASARTDMVHKLMKDAKCDLREEDYTEITSLTNGYSGSDMKSLCKEAAMGPIRSALSSGSIDEITCDNLRSVDISDFRAAVREVKASVSPGEVTRHEDFNHQFGALHM